MASPFSMYLFNDNVDNLLWYDNEFNDLFAFDKGFNVRPFQSQLTQLVLVHFDRYRNAVADLAVDLDRQFDFIDSQLREN